MNGTSVMTALGCLAFERALRLARWASALTAIACDAMRGNPAHFDARIFALKPHPGTQRAAAWIRADLARPGGASREPVRLQDRYSLRCAPHVIGVLLDALDFSRALLEIELNGVNDNPLVDPDTGDVLHGGNFYGGHVCFAIDGLKTAVANVADLLDRQLCLLCEPATSGGLPANLVAAAGPASVAHHGFKAMQITASALTAEALKLTMPASAFSRSTESHNQDKVSMGTIAARELPAGARARPRRWRPCTRSPLCQAVDLREAKPTACAAARCATRCARRCRSTWRTAARTATSPRCWRCMPRASWRRAISIRDERRNGARRGSPCWRCWRRRRRGRSRPPSPRSAHARSADAADGVDQRRARGVSRGEDARAARVAAGERGHALLHPAFADGAHHHPPGSLRRW